MIAIYKRKISIVNKKTTYFTAKQNPTSNFDVP